MMTMLHIKILNYICRMLFGFMFVTYTKIHFSCLGLSQHKIKIITLHLIHLLYTIKSPYSV